MMRNHLCCSALILLTVFGCGDGTAVVRCRSGEECVCLKCPAGQQPSKACGSLPVPEEDIQCHTCPPGTFSDSLDSELCRQHTSCTVFRRKVTTPGTLNSDATCGECLPGFQPTALRKIFTPIPCVKVPPHPAHVRAVRTVGKGPAGAVGLLNSTAVRSAEEKSAEYAVFALVPIFCVMGLLGILICNILKKKGYRCSTEKDGGEEDASTPQKEGNGCPYIPDDANEDTISVLVRLITEKKENAAALEELLLEYESKQMAICKASSIKFPVLSPLSQLGSLPRLCPHQSHLHTISGLSGLSSKHGYCCSRCAQRKWPPILIPPLDVLKVKTQTLTPPLDMLKVPMKTQTLILPSLDPPGQEKKSPLLGGVCVDTVSHPPVYTAPQGRGGEGEKEMKGKEPAGMTVLSVGRFQVAQILEQKPVTMETKPASREAQRSSLFGGSLFSSSSTRR